MFSMYGNHCLVTVQPMLALHDGTQVHLCMPSPPRHGPGINPPVRRPHAPPWHPPPHPAMEEQ